MNYLRIKKWEEFQHYKDRNPPWIKLHRGILDDYEFSCLQDASKAHLMLIWVFASQNGGKIPEDANFLQRKLGLAKPPDLEILINHGFLIREQVDSNALAEGLHDDSKLRLEKRREETEKNARAFAEFWEAYPRKSAKPDALKAWNSLSLHNGGVEKVMAGLAAWRTTEQWAVEKGRYIPLPATWLRKRRFEDENIAAAPEQKATLAL